MSKILEKIVFNHLDPFLTLHHLFSDDNSGFKPNDSAINRLLAVMEIINMGFDESSDFILVSLDISKAFNGVWHEGLLYTLKNGVSCPLHAWFANYLS